MPILLIDIGNSRIKWRAVELTHGWCDDDARGAIDHEDTAQLAGEWRSLCPGHAWLSSVASNEVRAAVERAFGQAAPLATLHRLAATAEAAGMRNDYRNPAQLGADRWAQAIGAHALFGGEDLLIASFGTASTLDWIKAEGLFAGGVILPGIELMRQSLARGTAGLPLAAGALADQFALVARDTDGAIVSGIAHAQAGALERIWRSVREESRPARVVLTGGAAEAVAGLLPFPATIVDNLVLRGLFEVARLSGSV